MAERRGADRVMQRQLSEPEPTPPAEGPDPPPDRDPETSERAPAERSIPRADGPSDAALRERQRLWWRERERFEAAQRRKATDEASK